MKARVKIKFYDTVAKKVRNVGEVFDLTASRFNEIRNKGNFVEILEDEKPTKA